MGRKKTALRITTLLAAGLLLPLTGLAATPSHFEDITVRVSYADLNIQNEAGARVLYRRLQRASEEACGVEPRGRLNSLLAERQAKACYQEALAAAVEKVDSEALTKIHES